LGNATSPSTWLMVDSEYEVLEIYAYPARHVELRVASSDNATPALFDSELFMTVDGYLPASWEAKIEEGGVLRIGPARWLEPGFWEAYFDGEPEFVKAYHSEVRPTG
jgi:hypothetical protein